MNRMMFILEKDSLSIGSKPSTHSLLHTRIEKVDPVTCIHSQAKTEMLVLVSITGVDEPTTCDRCHPSNVQREEGNCGNQIMIQIQSLIRLSFRLNHVSKVFDIFFL